jgi:hypothetical protein
MALGRPIFDYFQYPDADVALGHVLEYSQDHLDWQMKKAGFTRCRVEYSQMYHSPTNPLHRPLAGLGYPLHLIPHWRDNLVATAYAPATLSWISAETSGFCHLRSGRMWRIAGPGVRAVP